MFEKKSKLGDVMVKKQAEIIIFLEKTLEQNLGQILSERFFKTHGESSFFQLTHF